MKRALIILFTFLILSNSGGLVLAKHFCMGELVKIALSGDLHDCCDGMEMPSDCCNTENQELKLDDNTPITFYDFEVQEAVLLYTNEVPTLLKTLVPKRYTSNLHLLRPLTVPDILARKQSYLL